MTDDGYVVLNDTVHVFETPAVKKVMVVSS